MHIHCIPIYPYTGSGQKCREKHCKTHIFCRFVYKFISIPAHLSTGFVNVMYQNCRGKLWFSLWDLWWSSRWSRSFCPGKRFVQFIATSANNAPSMPRGFRVTMKGRQGQRRWWSLEVGVYRRIPYWQSPYTRIYLWHWGLTCAIYIYTQVSFHQCKWVWNQQMKLGVQLIIRFHQKTLDLIAQIPSNSWYTPPAVRLLTNMSFAIVAFSRYIVSVNCCISLVRILVPC